jgi:signal transduction histidine kinase
VPSSTGRLPVDEAMRHERFRDELIRPFLALTTIGVTAVQWPNSHIVLPELALPLFIVVALLALATIAPWRQVPQWCQVALLTSYALLASVLLPLAQTTWAPVFAFLASAVAGGKLISRRAAVGVAVVDGLASLAAVTTVTHLDPSSPDWPWWIALATGLPVAVGTSRRDRLDALWQARRAAAEAQRAVTSEAREAALVERARIAREIHDVLGHSLSGIALQLEMADALAGSDRRDEAVVAVRRARSLAVDSIAETRRAVHALREDTLPLDETLRLMAANEGVVLRTEGLVAAVPVESAHTVVRAAQEALTNATKYAPGAVRTMTLSFTDETVRLTVSNGPGAEQPPAGAGTGGGMGLVGMRERAALVGGTLRAGPHIEEGSEGGWTVELEVPR